MWSYNWQVLIFIKNPAKKDQFLCGELDPSPIKWNGRKQFDLSLMFENKVLSTTTFNKWPLEPTRTSPRKEGTRTTTQHVGFRKVNEMGGEWRWIGEINFLVSSRTILNNRITAVAKIGKRMNTYECCLIRSLLELWTWHRIYCMNGLYG